MLDSWMSPIPSTVTHESRQAVRREAGAPELRGVCHTGREGLSGTAPARCAPAPHIPTPHSLEVEAATVPVSTTLRLTVTHEAGRARAWRQNAKRRRQRWRGHDSKAVLPGAKPAVDW